MPSWRDLKRFCDRDGWELYKNTDHYFYRKIDENGNLRLTKVSRGTGEIKGFLWREILKNNLVLQKNILTAKFKFELKVTRNCGFFVCSKLQKEPLGDVKCYQKMYVPKRLPKRLFLPYISFK